MSKKFSGMQERLSNFQESLLQKEVALRTEERQIVEIPLEKLQAAPWNARRYFDPATIAKLAADLKKNGQIQPIIVRSRGNIFEIVVGNRRFHAALMAGLSALKTEVRELDDLAAQYLSLAENLQRVDLNALEETLGYTSLLLLVLQDLPEFKSFKRPDEQHDWAVERLLRRYANEVERTENNVILSGEGVVSEDIKTNYQVVGTSMEEAIQRVFSMASHMTWQSFVKNRLPLLRLPSDVIVAIQSGKLEYTKARKIGQLKSEEERQTLLQEAIDEGLSLAEVSERVKAYKSRGGPDKLDDLSTRSRAITKAFKQNPALAHKAKVKKAQRLLSELENLLGICHTD